MLVFLSDIWNPKPIRKLTRAITSCFPPRAFSFPEAMRKHCCNCNSHSRAESMSCKQAKISLPFCFLGHTESKGNIFAMTSSMWKNFEIPRPLHNTVRGEGGGELGIWTIVDLSAKEGISRQVHVDMGWFPVSGLDTEEIKFLHKRILVIFPAQKSQILRPQRAAWSTHATD